MFQKRTHGVCILHPASCILHLAYPICGFSKREPGIPPYCPIALPRPGYPAPGTRSTPRAEHRGPSLATGKRAHGISGSVSGHMSNRAIRPYGNNFRNYAIGMDILRQYGITARHYGSRAREMIYYPSLVTRYSSLVTSSLSSAKFITRYPSLVTSSLRHSLGTGGRAGLGVGVRPLYFGPRIHIFYILSCLPSEAGPNGGHCPSPT
jgi:hypothetical protein